MQSNNPSMQDLWRMAQSPAGKQLLQLLQQKGGDGLQQALSNAAAGNYADAKQALTDLMSDPEAKKLLEQLGR